MYKTIKNNTSAEIVVKKSKFIANLYYIQSEEEVKQILKDIRKTHYDARHHCFAYSILSENGTTNRMSDDGEPSGTAGGPLLNILNKNELINVLIVVTRYFGGILLGTGGLVKAYSDSALEAINKAEFAKEERGYEIEILVKYNDYEKLIYYCNINKLNVLDSVYEEKIKTIIEVTKEEKERLLNEKEELNFVIENIEIVKEKNIRKNIEI